MKTVTLWTKLLEKYAAFPVAAMALLLAPATAAGAVVYSEDFTRTGVSNLPVSNLGWKAFSGASATDISGNGATGTDYVAITPAAGNPNTTNGALYSVAGTVSGQIFSAVETFSSGISLSDPSTISWTMGNASTSSTVRLLIQIGGSNSVNSGTWYASDEVFSSSTAYGSFSNFSSASTPSVTYNLAFSTEANAWRELTLSPGISMSLSGSTLSQDLSSSTITGIGFYITATSNTNSAVRLDTLAVTVVPEPSSAALLLGSVGLFAVVFRTRKPVVR